MRCRRSLEMEFEQKTFLDVADSAQVAAAAKDRKKRTTEVGFPADVLTRVKKLVVIKKTNADLCNRQQESRLKRWGYS